MSRRKRTKTTARPGARPPPAPRTELRGTPLRVAQGLSGLVFALGVVMLTVGGLVAAGVVTEGWGFPMSAVPNWGRPWGMVLLLAGLAYCVAPVRLWQKPERGAALMMIVSGLSVVVGTPLITTTTEIVYNLFREVKTHPDNWSDPVWGYFMLLQIAIVIALYKAFPVPRETRAGTTGVEERAGTSAPTDLK